MTTIDELQLILDVHHGCEFECGTKVTTNGSKLLWVHRGTMFKTKSIEEALVRHSSLFDIIGLGDAHLDGLNTITVPKTIQIKPTLLQIVENACKNYGITHKYQYCTISYDIYDNPRYARFHDEKKPDIILKIMTKITSGRLISNRNKKLGLFLGFQTTTTK